VVSRRQYADFAARQRPGGHRHAKAPTLSALTHLPVFFLKTDSRTFGSGLVIVPFLEKDLVQQTGWLNGSEFLVAGFWGSLVSTIEIFLPSLFLIVAVAPILFRHRANPNVRASSRGPMPLRSARSIVGACVPPGQIARRLAHCTYSRRRSRGLAPLKSKQSTAHRRDRGHWVDHLPNPSAHMGTGEIVKVASESENRRQD
jgi:hypothetical protein